MLLKELLHGAWQGGMGKEGREGGKEGGKGTTTGMALTVYSQITSDFEAKEQGGCLTV